MSAHQKHSEKGGHPGGGVEKTKQSFRDETDINTIVKRHLHNSPGRNLANIGNPLASREPRFGHMPAKSFHEMLNAVTDIQTAFLSLPGKLRARFGGSPYQLLRWVEEPRNYKEAVKLGLIEDAELLEEVKSAEAAEAAKKAAEAAGQQNMMPKADSEAQPSYKPPEGGKK